MIQNLAERLPTTLYEESQAFERIMCLQLRDLREWGKGDKEHVKFRSQKVKSAEASTDLPWTEDLLKSRSTASCNKIA